MPRRILQSYLSINIMFLFIVKMRNFKNKIINDTTGSIFPLFLLSQFLGTHDKSDDRSKSIGVSTYGLQFGRPINVGFPSTGIKLLPIVVVMINFFKYMEAIEDINYNNGITVNVVITQEHVEYT